MPANSKLVQNSFLILPVLLLLLTLIWPSAGQAQFTFVTNADHTITITGYTGPGGYVTIPSSTNGYPVKSLGTGTFYNQTNVIEVTIPDSVTSVGDFAFFGCSSLPILTIPDSVTNIGVSPFWGCSNLTSMAIPARLTSIGDQPFGACFALTNISVDVANPNYASAGGVLFDKNMANLIECPAGLSGAYSMPGSLTNVVDFAFYQCSRLTNVIISDNVTSLGGHAFASCASLTNLFFGEGLTSIGENAFELCPGLGNITIGNRVTSLGQSAFNLCSGLTNVTIGNGITNIGLMAFSSCRNLHQVFFLGNAPKVNGRLGSLDNTLFSFGTGTVYYLPGTTGWGATFGGWPTARWYQPQPQILGSSSNFGIPGNGFQFTISWATNTPVVVDSSTNLLNWVPQSTNNLVNGTNAFRDSTWTNYPQRFYRVRSL